VKILYFCSTWGLDDLPDLEAKLAKIKEGGYDGVELDIPTDVATCRRARRVLDELQLEIVAQQWRTGGPSAAAHMAGLAEQYHRATELRPLFVNSHTGRDHFSLEENLAILDHAATLADAGGVPILHETHRGRAMFSAPATEALLRARPGLRLVADFSHWCCVHESLLEDQAERVELAARRSYAIHARVGHTQGPQIPDPRDPRWEPNLQAHLAWWKSIVAHRRAEGCPFLTICPEFGPPPYMTLLPFSQQPVADLWEINCSVREWLRERLSG
jgi:hypothetical protein